MNAAVAVLIVVLLAASAGEGFEIAALQGNVAALNQQLGALKAQVSSPYPLTLVDDMNRSVTIAHQPERIVSIEPSDTQIVFALGEGSKVVGATQYDDWPSSLVTEIGSGRVASVGGIVDSSVNVETVVGLAPDLVLAWGDGNEQAQTIRQIVNVGIPVLVLNPQNMNQIYGDVLLVGKALGASQNASLAVSNMKAVVSFVSDKVGGTPTPSVFYEIWNDPIITAGSTSFISELISEGGGVNVFSNSTEQYPTVGAETVVALNPQVILASSEFNMTVAQVGKQPGFATTAAVQSGRVYIIQNPSTLQEPGPRLIEGLLTLAELLHPGAFSAQPPNVIDDATGEFNGSLVNQLR